MALWNRVRARGGHGGNLRNRPHTLAVSQIGNKFLREPMDSTAAGGSEPMTKCSAVAAILISLNASGVAGQAPPVQLPVEIGLGADTTKARFQS
jgi:hypothetical protein